MLPSLSCCNQSGRGTVACSNQQQREKQAICNPHSLAPLPETAWAHTDSSPHFTKRTSQSGWTENKKNLTSKSKRWLNHNCCRKGLISKPKKRSAKSRLPTSKNLPDSATLTFLRRRLRTKRSTTWKRRALQASKLNSLSTKFCQIRSGAIALVYRRRTLKKLLIR